MWCVNKKGGKSLQTGEVEINGKVAGCWLLVPGSGFVKVQSSKSNV